MKAIAVVGVCEVMIIWIIATYVTFGICFFGIGNGDAEAGCVVCLGFVVKTP